MKILGGLAILLQKEAIEGVVDFQERKMLEILGYALNRQGFFAEGFVSDFVAPARNPFVIPPRGINLPDPPGIPVTGRADQDIFLKPAEKEFLWAG